MARLNIEECWWSDPRRTALLLEIGFEADSAAVNMWRIAQEFWSKGKALIPSDVFEKLKYSSALIRAGLADVRESFVYVRGSSEYLTWVEEKREQAREAGKKSAEARRAKNGTAQPNGGKQDKKIERESNDIRTESNGIEPSGSGSGSGSEKLLRKGKITGDKSPGEQQAATPLGQEIVGEYYRLWRDKYHSRAPLLPQDQKKLKKLAEELGVDTARTLLRAYFTKKNKWFEEKGHDVQTLMSNLAQIQADNPAMQLVRFAVPD